LELCRLALDPEEGRGGGGGGAIGHGRGGQAQAACADACGSEKGGPVDEYEMLDVNPTVEK
jgi:hypothetical protein